MKDDVLPELHRLIAVTILSMGIGLAIDAPTVYAATDAGQWDNLATEWVPCAAGKEIDWRARVVEEQGSTVSWEAQFRNRSSQPLDVNYVYGATNEARPFKNLHIKVEPGQTSEPIQFSLVNPANPHQVWMTCDGRTPGSVLTAPAQSAVQDRFTLEGQEYGYICNRDPEAIPAGWDKVRDNAPFLTCGFGGGIMVMKKR